VSYSHRYGCAPGRHAHLNMYICVAYTFYTRRRRFPLLWRRHAHLNMYTFMAYIGYTRHSAFFSHCCGCAIGLPAHFGLHKIFFYFKAYAHESITPHPTPPMQCPHYCNTTARPLRTERLLPVPPFVCHTPINIGNGDTM